MILLVGIHPWRARVSSVATSVRRRPAGLGQGSARLGMGWGDAEYRGVPGPRLAVPAQVAAEPRGLDEPVRVRRGLGDLGRQPAQFLEPLMMGQRLVRRADPPRRAERLGQTVAGLG